MVLQASISQSAPSASSLVNGLTASNAGSSLISNGIGLTNMIGNMVYGAWSSKKAYKRQIRLMQRQAKLNYDYSTKFAEEQGLRQYPRLRESLESANFNPLLAIQGANAGVASGTNFGSAPNSPMATTDASAFNSGVAGANAAQLIDMQKQNLSTNTKLQQSQGALAMAQEEKTDAETGNINLQNIADEIRNKYLDEQYRNTLQNILQDTELKKAQAYQAVSNADSQALMASNDYRRTGEMINVMRTQGVINKNQAKQLEIVNKYIGPKMVTDMIFGGITSGSSIINAIKGTGSFPFSSQSYNMNVNP